MANKKSKLVAVPIARAVEIFCPDDECCNREDPIPSPDGSFMWDSMPETVTCPDCGKTYRVSKKIKW